MDLYAALTRRAEPGRTRVLAWAVAVAVEEAD